MRYHELIKTLSEVGQDDYPTIRHEAQRKLEALGVSFEKPKTPPYDPIAEAAHHAQALLNMESAQGYINNAYIFDIVRNTLNKIVDANGPVKR